MRPTPSTPEASLSYRLDQRAWARELGLTFLVGWKLIDGRRSFYVPDEDLQVLLPEEHESRQTR